MPQEQRHPIAKIVIALIVVAGLGLLFGPQIYNVFSGSRLSDAERRVLLENAEVAFGAGDFNTARNSFEQARAGSMQLDERAQYEILIAATYETSDLAQAAEMYLRVINNPGYSPAIRSYAASYLLLALSNQYNPSVAQIVFSNDPWRGFMNKGATSERGRYDLALSRAHEWALRLSPNFLSYFLAGEIYARSYDQLSDAQKKNVFPKISSYYDLGAAAFAAFAVDPGSHPNLIATGYRAQAVYAEYVLKLSEKKLVSGVSISAEDVEMRYDEAEEYIATLRDSSFKDAMKFTTLLYHARSLGTRKETAERARIGGELAPLISTNRDMAQAAQQYGDATGSFSGPLRDALILTAKQSPALKDALLTQTTSFTSKDFI